MPLLDHFRPPLSQRRHWDSLYGAWAEAMATNPNDGLQGVMVPTGGGS